MLNLRSDSQIVSVLDFYEKNLKDVEFPQINRGILVEEHQKLKDIQQEIGKQEQQLLELKEKENQRFTSLEKMTQQALSYAEIYLFDDEEKLTACQNLAEQFKGIKRKTKATSRKKVTKKKPVINDKRHVNKSEIIALDLKNTESESKEDESNDIDLKATVAAESIKKKDTIKADGSHSDAEFPVAKSLTKDDENNDGSKKYVFGDLDSAQAQDINAELLLQDETHDDEISQDIFESA